MEYLLIQKEGFKELYLNEIKKLEGSSSSELIEQYNKQVDIGIVGVYRQAVFLVALRKVFKDRFNQSPVHLKDNVLVSLTSKVKHKEDALYYLNDQPVKA